MARHRRIEMKIHADEKYRRLTPPPPCGQVLWFHLIAGEQTGIIPGIFCIGEAAFAEQLRWSLKGFRDAFKEITDLKMAEADWQSRLVWVPNAIKYNTPPSPNVITSWRAFWDVLPECPLKVKAYEHLKAFVEGMSKGFREAFAKTIAKPFEKPFGNPTEKPSGIQEQEQEAGTGVPPTPPTSGGLDLSDIPSELDTPEFRVAWVEWVADRKARKKPVTAAAAKLQFKSLAPIGPVNAVKCIHEAIEKGWTGLVVEKFQPGAKGQSGGSRPHFQTQDERVMTELKEAMEAP